MLGHKPDPLTHCDYKSHKDWPAIDGDSPLDILVIHVTLSPKLLLNYWVGWNISYAT
jgi:hypothetical protein